MLRDVILALFSLCFWGFAGLFFYYGLLCVFMIDMVVCVEVCYCYGSYNIGGLF